MSSEIVELNVGGAIYASTRDTLLGGATTASSLFHDLLLASSSSSSGTTTTTKAATNGVVALRDNHGRLFLDRDPQIFRHILAYLRSLSERTPPFCIDSQTYVERKVLRQEAEFFKLPNLISLLDESVIPSNGYDSMDGSSGHITIGVRCKFGGETNRHMSAQLSDLRFRKCSRILVMGRAGLCRHVFGEDLNESRDPDSANNKYATRFYLNHMNLETAFDCLGNYGFSLKAVSNHESKENDENDDKWLFYKELIFQRL